MKIDAVTDKMSGVKPAVNQEWWRGAILYQIYPRSFKDTNGDGIGDLAGITENLEYVAGLGVDAIWLSPFFTSPMKDFGYDISDYYDVDPNFGTLDDFRELIKKAHRLDLKVIIDQVYSHTSDQHAWFCESRINRTNEKSDWYVWADPKSDGNVPNNWQSVFGGSAWQWESRRKQYYLHNFLPSQPDLNFHNPDVQNAVLDAARFWLELGVDGFRLDVINFYFHHQSLSDNPPADRDDGKFDIKSINPYSYQSHRFDKSQPEMSGFLIKLRNLLDQYGATTSVGEIGDEERSLELMAHYTGDSNKLHMAYTFDLLSVSFSSDYLYKVIETFENQVSDGWACWSIGNHDVQRVATRWGAEMDAVSFAKTIFALQLSLRGSYCIYQGDELGLTEASIPFEKLQDPFGRAFWPEFTGRDGCRTPIPWHSDETHCGFTQAAQAWLPLAPDHCQLAVNLQQQDPGSILNHYRQFIRWRKQHPLLRFGNIRMIKGLSDGLIGLHRYDDKSAMVCYFNITDRLQITHWPFESAEPLLGNFFPDAHITENRLRLPACSAFFAYINMNQIQESLT